jgi:hypothetical protein
MAATIAGLIRGRDVIAAHQLDVDLLAFDDVIRILEEAEFVQGVRRSGNKIIAFTETVPYYDDLYQTLGESWTDRLPTDVEQQLLTVVDGLSTSPIPVESLQDRYSLRSGEVVQRRRQRLYKQQRTVFRTLTRLNLVRLAIVESNQPRSASRPNCSQLCRREYYRHADSRTRPTLRQVLTRRERQNPDPATEHQSHVI